MPETGAKQNAAPIQTARLRVDFWQVGSFLFAALAVLPVLAIIWLALFPEENIWPHLISTSLPGYLKSTLILMFGVGHRGWPGRQLFHWGRQRRRS